LVSIRSHIIHGNNSQLALNSMTPDSSPLPNDTSAEQVNSIGTPPANCSANFPARKWAICLFLVTLGGWATLNFVPVKPETPERLMGVDIDSPQALQTEADAYFLKVGNNARFRQMSMLGGCLGLAPLLFFGLTRRRGWLLAGIIAAVFGVPLGHVANEAGEATRSALVDATMPLVNEANRLVVADAIVFACTSILLLLPIAIAFVFSDESQRNQKAIACVMAAMVGGGVLPLVGSIALPLAQTNRFPPEGLSLTAIWLVTLILFTVVVTTMTGSRKHTQSATPATGDLESN
jgi:hypothetical protein